MPEKIRFGIIGCGGISRWHARAIGGIARAEVGAVCDAAPDAAREFGREIGAEWYADEGQMLSEAAIDAVCICTPSGLHAEQAIRALRAGKHAVVEKPFAITPESLERVLLAARETGLRLCAISQMRFLPEIRLARELICGGALGKIALADLSMKYYREQSYYAAGKWRGTFAMDGGGALMNQGIHGLDMLRFLCGDIGVVSASAATLAHAIETEDTLCAHFTLEGGGMGVLTAATSAWPGHRRRLEVCGTEGSMALVEGRIAAFESKSGRRIDISPEGGGLSGEKDPLNIDTEPHRAQIGAFVDAVLAGRAPEPQIEDAAATLRAIFAIYEAARAGRAAGQGGTA
ncbi:MAG: Gfo/Idh/MocA family oxidoreductase [Clostridiales bacterium]|nr:Gfo/Idh/MocA family oxidoreductase [Clostridiales bacterium]